MVHAEGLSHADLGHVLPLLLALALLLRTRLVLHHHTNTTPRHTRRISTTSHHISKPWIEWPSSRFYDFAPGALGSPSGWRPPPRPPSWVPPPPPPHLHTPIHSPTTQTHVSTPPASFKVRLPHLRQVNFLKSDMACWMSGRTCVLVVVVVVLARRLLGRLGEGVTVLLHLEPPLEQRLEVRLAQHLVHTR